LTIETEIEGQPLQGEFLRTAKTVNVRSALNLAEREQFDVLISDIGLPDGSGTELMKSLQSHRPLFGIALTGYGMEDDIQKSYDSGFNHHLVKPVDLNRLDQLIQQGLMAPTPESAAVAAGK
jgi:CheY-like chemotaxis protein